MPLLVIFQNIQGRRRRMMWSVSVMRDAIDKNFTTKEVQYSFRKMCIEFKKRINPDLPYYYHTSSHTRFHEGPLPSFNEPSSKPKRKHKCAPRREQPAAFTPGRVSMPVWGSMSVQAQFHNQPVELLPPPSMPVHISDHTYSKQVVFKFIVLHRPTNVEHRIHYLLSFVPLSVYCCKL